ncbi:MAG: septal ring lytic transglycosylase RlpA family protein [Candidatus Competibacteraceae bacterium]|nr:septal ring lytic transglycosylase RlpA family protein [Candidatus Competibacteraceae bacterium]MBK8964302.1 septal ring lytic transglycosylase RlpA family protein [Candidatus Competibacteraceae bacterium]MBK9950329.1 septal ring lytic transglycosylase RlpA family protein [Candidatus Competibacteraceae bacterium]
MNLDHIDNSRPRKGPRRFSRVLMMAALALAVAAPQYAGARGAQVGKASWYGPGFHGKKTASGVRFNQNSLTAAHRSLPLGTRARVTNLTNGRKVDVTINDRGPYIGGRVIDLSRAAATRLAMNTSGVARVRIEPMGR